MKNKGFTLIEILAVIVIIGIVSTIGIISVSNNIGKSRDASVVDLAKTYAEAARSMKGSGELYYEPKTKEAIILPYKQINNVDIENKDVTGYGDLIPSYCYVGIVNDGKKNVYYVTQLDDTYHFIDRAEYNALSKTDIVLGEEELVSRRVKEIKAPYSSFNITYGTKQYNIKGLRVKYYTRTKGIVPENNSQQAINDAKTTKVTRFETKDLKGYLRIHTNNVVDLIVESSLNDLIPKGNYVLNVKSSKSGYTGIWSRSGENIKVAIKNAIDEKVVFDIFLHNEKNNSDNIYIKDIETTNRVEIHGYYTSDNSYLSMTAHTRGNINIYDSYIATGTLPGATNEDRNVITYNGIKFAIDNHELLYILLKTN